MNQQSSNIPPGPQKNRSLPKLGIFGTVGKFREHGDEFENVETHTEILVGFRRSSDPLINSYEGFNNNFERVFEGLRLVPLEKQKHISPGLGWRVETNLFLACWPRAY